MSMNRALLYMKHLSIFLVPDWFSTNACSAYTFSYDVYNVISVEAELVCVLSIIGPHSSALRTPRFGLGGRLGTA